MKLLIINLAKDVDRLTSSREKFTELGLTFEPWPGVDGRELSPAELQAFAATRPRDGKYIWSPGKVGCFLSHYSVWKYCAEGPDPQIAIFEDDLYLSPELPYFLADTRWLPPDFDIIRMESPTNRVKTEAMGLQFRGRDILRLRSTAWCAGSYILSKRGAAKLLSVPEKFHHNPDRLMFCYEDSVIAKQLVTYQVAPSLTVQDKYFHSHRDQVLFSSNIETPEDGSTDRIGLGEKCRHLSFAEIALIVKKTLFGYKRIPFKL